MFEQSFQYEQFSGVVRRADPRRLEVDIARYMHVLSSLPEFDMLRNLATTAGYTMAGPVGEFIDASRHIQEFVGLTLRTEKQTKDGPEIKETPIAWPKPTGLAAHMAAAFEFWLDHEDLFKYLKGLYDALDNPNGDEGKPGEALTADEKANPT